MNDPASSPEPHPWQFSLAAVLGAMVGVGLYLVAWKAQSGVALAWLTLTGAAVCEALAARSALNPQPDRRTMLRHVACLLAFAGPWLLFVGTGLAEKAPILLLLPAPRFFLVQGGLVVVQTLGAYMVFGAGSESRGQVVAGLAIVAVMSLLETLLAILVTRVLGSL